MLISFRILFGKSHWALSDEFSNVILSGQDLSRLNIRAPTKTEVTMGMMDIRNRLKGRP
jgi:hypothetical protein